MPRRRVLAPQFDYFDYFPALLPMICIRPRATATCALQNLVLWLRSTWRLRYCQRSSFGEVVLVYPTTTTPTRLYILQQALRERRHYRSSLSEGLRTGYSSVRTAGGATDRRWLKARRINEITYYLFTSAKAKPIRGSAANAFLVYLAPRECVGWLQMSFSSAGGLTVLPLIP